MQFPHKVKYSDYGIKKLSKGFRKKNRIGTALRYNRNNSNCIVVKWDTAKGVKTIFKDFLEPILTEE